MKKPTLAFALSVFLGAFLLFQLQPLVGKMILPWFGGSPSVWSTCMLVFQVLLFAGYSYAFASVTFLTPRRQLIVHGVLIVASIATLPIVPADSWKPTGSETPVLRIILVLLSSVGLPFLTLSSTGPLLQAWFHRLSPEKSPYRLYALSNLGSLLALLTFPSFFEPRMSVGSMAMLWAVGFISYAITSSMAGWDAARGLDRTAAKLPDANPSQKEEEQRLQTPSLTQQAFWFLLAAVPSLLLLATTNHICQDIASVPFLWIMPLAIYLVTFIIAFDSSRWYFPNVYAGLTLVGGMMMAYLLGLESYLPAQFQVLVFLGGLFVCSMFCHGELARSKPTPKYLTLFYLVCTLGERRYLLN